MIKLGFVSAILSELSFEEVVSFAAQEGFSCVELMCWPHGKAERRYAGVTHVDVDALDAAAAKRMHKHLEEKKVSISGLGYYPNPLDPDEKAAGYYRDHIRKVIDAAALLSVGVVNTFIGRDPEKSLAENFKKFAAVWPEIVSHAESRNVKIAIENCPMLFTDDEWPGGKNMAISPAVWRRMFSEIPSKNFGLNIDPSHLLWQQMDYVKPIYEFAGRIFHVHIKDAAVRRDRLDDVGILATPLEFHAPKLPGQGDVHWGKFISALNEIGYTGGACIEVEDRSFEETLESRKAALALSGKYMRQFVAA
jgi:sugar phosphate isomerase/epimerase